MAWVQQIQDGSVRWEIEDTAALVKTSLMKGWSDGLRERMLTSRAARAAGLSCVKELPDEFIQVVFGGGPPLNVIGHENVRKLTRVGLLSPQRKQGCQDEFVRLRWDSMYQVHVIPNPIMAQFYNDEFLDFGGQRLELTKPNPLSALDLLVRALPFMSFMNVIDNDQLVTGDETKKFNLVVPSYE